VVRKQEVIGSFLFARDTSIESSVLPSAGKGQTLPGSAIESET